MPNSNKEVICNAAALRGQGRLQEAIDLIEANIGNIDQDIRVIALREAFLAAAEMGNSELAKSYAEQIAITDPDMPSIQKYI